MSLGLAISGFLPSIVSKGIFAPRRVEKAKNAHDSIVSAGNMCVADAQIVKAGEGVVGIARESKNSIAKKIVAFDEAVKEGAKTSNALRTVGKVGQVAIDNINPLITGVSIFNVATADNKEKEATEQFFLLGGMFGAEGAYKAITGMAKTKRVNGKTVIVPVDGLYKENSFAKKQVEAFKKACAKTKFMNKSLKHAPKVVKGVGFAIASISGSYAGHEFIGKPVANALFGEEKKNKQTKNNAKASFLQTLNNKENAYNQNKESVQIKFTPTVNTYGTEAKQYHSAA